MSDASLKIVIGADVKDAVSGIKQTEAELNNLTNQTNKATVSQNALGKTTTTVANSLGDISGAISTSAAGAGKLSQTVITASGSLSNLASAAASGSGSIEDLVSSLGGAAPVLGVLALAVIYAGKQFLEFLKITDQAKLSYEKFTDSLKTAKEDFESINEQIKFQGDYTKALDDLLGKPPSNKLLDEIKNNNSALGEAKLRFTDLSIARNKIFEAGSNKTIDKDESTKQLIENAKELEAVNKRITELNQKNSILNVQAQKAQQDEQQKLVDNQKKIADQLQQQNISQLQATLSFQEATKKALQDSLDKTGPTDAKFRESIDGALGKINFDILRTQVALKTAEGIKEGVRPEVIKQFSDALRNAYNVKANPDLSVPLRFDLQTDTSELTKKIETFKGKLDKLASLNLTIKGFDQAAVKKASDAAKKLADRLAKTISDGFTSAINSGFETLGQDIGSGIAAGQSFIEIAGNSILDAVGGIIQDIGKALLEYGIVKSGLDEVLKGGIAIPGVVAIAAGVAAIAIGQLVKSLSKPHAFAEGGIVTGPTLGLVGEAGPEAIFPLSKLDRFLKTQSGGGSLVVVEGHLRGQDIFLQQQRVVKLNGIRG